MLKLQKTFLLQMTEFGLVKIEGDTWSAISENEEEIKKGTEVEIKKIEGVKLIVTPIK